MQFSFSSPMKINFRSVIVLFRFFLPVIFLICGSFHTEPVYHLICTGPYAKSYHKDHASRDEYCRGLKSCRSDIKRLSAEEAKKLRPDPCDYCHGH